MKHMRNVLLVILVLSLLITGCATTQEEVVDTPATVTEPAGETGVDVVEAVDDTLVEDDLEESMDSIDLDNW